MIKQVLVLLALAAFIAAQSCVVNQSGSNQASARQNTLASSTCLANQSGSNQASARRLRQTAVCSGHGSCDGNSICVCDAEWTGVDCETSCATTVAPTTVAPTTAQPTTGPLAVCPENQSGSNNAAAGRQNSAASSTCLANQSGANLASRLTAPCSGNGQCDGSNFCVCAAGYTGVDCEISCVAQSTTSAPVEQSTTSAPVEQSTTSAPVEQSTTSAPVEQSTTSAPVEQSTIAATTVAPTTVNQASGSPIESTTSAPLLPTCSAANTIASNTCLANQSGSNQASARQAGQCSGNGSCDGNNFCVCAAGWMGVDCDTKCSTNANQSGNDNARSSASRVLSVFGVIASIATVALM